MKMYSGDRNHFFMAEEGFLYSLYDACELTYAGNSRGSAFLDFDDDGDLDVVLNDYRGPARLYRNEQSTGNSWIRLQLEGTRSNRNAIGARVRVVDSTGRVQHAIVVSGSGYLSQNPMALHFGLGRAERVREVRIEWPAGGVQHVADLEPNRRHRILEPENL